MLSIKEKQAILRGLFQIAIDYEEATPDCDYMQGVYSGAKQIFINLFGYDPYLMVRDVTHNWKLLNVKQHYNTQGNYVNEMAIIYAKDLKSNVR